MQLAMALYGLFALLSAVGAFLILAHARGRRAAVVGVVVTLVFFAALLAGLFALFHEAGLSPVSPRGAAAVELHA